MAAHGRCVPLAVGRVLRTPDVTTADSGLRWTCLASGRLESAPVPQRWTTVQEPGHSVAAVRRGRAHAASGRDQGAGPGSSEAPRAGLPLLGDRLGWFA